MKSADLKLGLPCTSTILILNLIDHKKTNWPKGGEYLIGGLKFSNFDLKSLKIGKNWKNWQKPENKNMKF